MKKLSIEDKELLLKDLCARLLYGVLCRITDTNDKEFQREGKLTEIRILDTDANGTTFVLFNEHVPCYSNITEIKPYLRPMSSMTEKEKKEFKDTFYGFFQYFNHGIISDSRVWDKNEAVFVGELSCSRLVDWLNKHHFDFRGLLKKGIAIEASAEMYK